jgi:hypothetical protein
LKSTNKPKKNDLEWLGEFYSQLCDGDWEHSYGVDIRTQDNPGWRMEFNLTDTVLENIHFELIRDLRTDNDWVIYKRDGSMFVAAGGSNNLSEIIGYFRKWVEKHVKEDENIWNPDLAE